MIWNFKEKGRAHLGYHSTGPDTIIETHPPLVVSIFSLVQKVLVTHKVWPLVYHPVSTFNLNRVTATEMRVQVSTVTSALIEAALKVLVFIEDDL